jgi:hypothetical protein
MATTLVSLFVGFILTGIVGTWLSQRWQHRSWINQQQILGEEKSYYDLKTVWDEVTTLSGKRQWRMQRLLNSIKMKNIEKANLRLQEYDDVVSEWNEKRNSFEVRLTLFAGWDLTTRLEELNAAFTALGVRLERLFNNTFKGIDDDSGELARLEKKMRWLSFVVFQFNRDVLHAVERKRERTYYGTEIKFGESTLEHFGTWELAKALFKPGVKPLRVIRTSAELPLPFRGGSERSGIN